MENKRYLTEKIKPAYGDKLVGKFACLGDPSNPSERWFIITELLPISRIKCGNNGDFKYSDVTAILDTNNPTRVNCGKGIYLSIYYWKEKNLVLHVPHKLMDFKRKLEKVKEFVLEQIRNQQGGIQKT